MWHFGLIYTAQFSGREVACGIPHFVAVPGNFVNQALRINGLIERTP
jgi:hypothetical protein